MSVKGQVATRRNDRDLGVANGDRWTVTAINDQELTVSGTTSGHGIERKLPAEYVRPHVELAYITIVHGAQGDTLDTAHFLRRTCSLSTRTTRRRISDDTIPAYRCGQRADPHRAR